MAELKRIGEAGGFGSVRTFIASGNLLFTSDLTEAEAQKRIEAKLEAFFGKPVPVFVRTAGELAATAAANPFDDGRPGLYINAQAAGSEGGAVTSARGAAVPEPAVLYTYLGERDSERLSRAPRTPGGVVLRDDAGTSPDAAPRSSPEGGPR